MPYNPGVQDISGQLRAQGLAGGGRSFAQGLSQGIAKWEKNKEEDKMMQGIIKSAEMMAKGFGEVAGSIDPKLGAAIEKMRESMSDPNKSTRERAMAADSFQKGIGDILNTGMQGMQMQAQRAHQEQIAMAKAAELKAAQDKLDRERMIGELEPLIAAGVKELPKGATPDMVYQATFNLWKKESEMNKGLLENRKTAAEIEKLTLENSEAGKGLGAPEILNLEGKKYARVPTSKGQSQLLELNKEFSGDADDARYLAAIQKIKEAEAGGESDKGYEYFLTIYPKDIFGNPPDRSAYETFRANLKGEKTTQPSSTATGTTTLSNGLKLPPGTTLVR